MGGENPRGLGGMTVGHLREYILDMVQELAAVAARQGDAPSAQALQVCWNRIREIEDHH